MQEKCRTMQKRLSLPNCNQVLDLAPNPRRTEEGSRQLRESILEILQNAWCVRTGALIPFFSFSLLAWSA